MTAIIQPPLAADSFLDAPIIPSAVLNPALQWSNLFDDPQNDLRPTRSYNPQKEPYRRPSKSTAYISRENLSPERIKHLERNRIAANKCRLKKKQEHREMQSNFDEATAKHNALLAEISVLKEDVWQLRNQILQHAAGCDDQDIKERLAQMTQNINHATIQSPQPSFSVSTIRDESMESEQRLSKSNLLAKSSSTQSSGNPKNLFDRLIDTSTL